MRLESAGRAAESMLSPARLTVEVAGDGWTPKDDLDGTLVESLKNETPNLVVVLEDSRCDGNGRGAIVYRSESLMGHDRGDSEDLQWSEVACFGDGHDDVPSGEDPVTPPTSGQVDQLADITSYDA